MSLSLAALQLLWLHFFPNFVKKNLQSSLFSVLHFTAEYFLFYFILWHITQFYGYTNNNLSTLNAKELSKEIEKLWCSYTCLIYLLRAIRWWVFQSNFIETVLKGRPCLKVLKARKEKRMGALYNVIVRRIRDMWTKHCPQDGFGWKCSEAMRIEKPE